MHAYISQPTPDHLNAQPNQTCRSRPAALAKHALTMTSTSRVATFRLSWSWRRIWRSDQPPNKHKSKASHCLQRVDRPILAGHAVHNSKSALTRDVSSPYAQRAGHFVGQKTHKQGTTQRNRLPPHFPQDRGQITRGAPSATASSTVTWYFPILRGLPTSGCSVPKSFLSMSHKHIKPPS
jgi:hypothetical protein